MSTAAQSTKDTTTGIEGVVLAWQLAQPSGAGTRSAAEKALKPLLGVRLSDAERRRSLEEAWATLERAGHVTFPRRGAVVITEGGRRTALDALGVESLPGRIRWKAVKRRYLIPRSLGRPAPRTKAEVERIGKKEGLFAAILAWHYDLDIGSYPTLRQVRDRLAWRSLGVDTKEPFTLKAVLARLMSRAFGRTATFETSYGLALAAANAIGAPRAEPGELETALIWRWIDGRKAARGEGSVSSAAAGPGGGAPVDRGTAPSPNAVGDVVARVDDDSSAFAARVLAVARGSETGRFGSNKVFISHVFRKLVQMGAVPGDAEAFKDRLVSAHREGLLSLSRADLVEAMDPKDTEASETRHLSATFHFVVI
ncbi:hypothetical protein sce7122 [Sorangium cellulosum So ce56]|uniref:Uncharacterized protein n=1 Tax=Sorangium cellulosum (strain So ce56) TaxID=448385 RepID=A9ERF8_SORC5|nr:hypothetical protein [Sorangium cellulosum]CAN97291.1 hypothetical protein sce7122 [Sorangium cellulosum So ce56]